MNPIVFYAVILLGLISLAVGLYYLSGFGGDHPTRVYAGIGAGVVLIIAGIVGLVTRARPRE